MRYDRGFGPGESRGRDWTGSYRGGERGYDRGYRLRDRGDTAERPWVGSYRGEFQGGSGGYAVNTSGPLDPSRTVAGRPMRGGYDENFARDRARNGVGRRPGGVPMQGRGIDVGNRPMRPGADYGRDFRGRPADGGRGYDWRYRAGNEHPPRHGGLMRGSMSSVEGIGRWDPWF